VVAATEGIIAGVEDIVGIMAGMVDITAEATSTEVRVSSSADTMGIPTTIRTGIILTPIITRHLITILINRMLIPSLPPTPKRARIIYGRSVPALMAGGIL
jgi:hypothetical protein